MNTITLQSFSPLAPVFLKTLGLEDKNNNGTIDQGAGEGYEQFAATYGNADIGYKNSFNLPQGAADARLSEKEILDFYYLKIRFAFPKETVQIDTSLDDLIRKSGIFPAWLLDPVDPVAQGLLPATDVIVTTENIAVLMEAAFKKLKPILRAGVITYSALNETVRTKKFDCYEASMFCFWYTSQVKVRAMPMHIYYELGSPELIQAHLLIKLPDLGQIVDLTAYNKSHYTLAENLVYDNPLQCLGEYYFGLAETPENRYTPKELYYLELGLQYQKDNLDVIRNMMYKYLYEEKSPQINFARVIDLGEYILANVDWLKFTAGELYPNKFNKEIIQDAVCMLVEAYGETGDRANLQRLRDLAVKYLSDSSVVQSYLADYK